MINWDTYVFEIWFSRNLNMNKNNNPQDAPIIVPAPRFMPVCTEFVTVSPKQITAVRHAKKGSLGIRSRHKKTAIPNEPFFLHALPL